MSDEWRVWLVVAGFLAAAVVLPALMLEISRWTHSTSKRGRVVGYSLGPGGPRLYVMLDPPGKSPSSSAASDKEPDQSPS